MRANWAGCFLPSPSPYPPGYSGRREYSAPHLSCRLLITMQNGQASGTGDPARRASGKAYPVSDDRVTSIQY
jgi:hypothetical protein